MATLFIGQNRIFLNETESTNSYAINLLKNVNLVEGTVIYAEKQSAGKGQRGNVWHAHPSMNLTLSLVIKPGFLSIGKSFYLSKITALAIYDLLTELLDNSQYDIKIKWPNDMLVNSKKVAGILIENGFKEQNIIYSIVGIGLNVNQTFFQYLPLATSLNILTAKNFSLDVVMNRLFVYFEKWYLCLREQKYKEINATYLKNVYGLNTICSFEQDGKTFKALVKDINENGFLVLEDEEKQIKQFDIKGIKWLF